MLKIQCTYFELEPGFLRAYVRLGNAHCKCDGTVVGAMSERRRAARRAAGGPPSERRRAAVGVTSERHCSAVGPPLFPLSRMSFSATIAFAARANARGEYSSPLSPPPGHALLWLLFCILSLLQCLLPPVDRPAVQTLQIQEVVTR